MELVELDTGVDLFDAVVATATGRPPPVDRTRDAAAGVRFPPIAPATTLPSAELEALAGQPGVVRVEVDAHPGSKVPPLRWSRDRVGRRAAARRPAGGTRPEHAGRAAGAGRPAESWRGRGAVSVVR
jgi:hypothetical protein